MGSGSLSNIVDLSVTHFRYGDYYGTLNLPPNEQEWSEDASAVVQWEGGSRGSGGKLVRPPRPFRIVEPQSMQGRDWLTDLLSD